MYVYLLENAITGKRYVGQTRTSLRKRFGSHVSNARSDHRLKSPLKNALLKYGADAFRMTVLGEYATQAETDAAEAHFIPMLGTLAPNGYNLRHGGLEGSHSEESRAKLRGIRRSEETRAKLRGIIKSPEWRARIGDAHRGRPPHPNSLEALARGRSRPRAPRPGELNPRALLTAADVREIRRRYAAGEGSQQAIADEYGVKQVTVSAIVRRRTWRHVSERAPRYAAPGTSTASIRDTRHRARVGAPT